MNSTNKTQEGYIPQVSIGMPAYNGEKFIREAIDSLLAQTFTDFELIISDDASTDGTETICRDYAAKDSRVRYIRQTENLGGGANFKIVLAEARGKYFMFASNDDIWSPNWLTGLTTALQDAPRSASFGSAVYVDAQGHKLNSTANYIYFRFCEYQYFRIIKFIFTPHLTGKMILLFSLFPREALSKICNGDAEITGNNSQDLHFVFSMLSHLKFIPVQDCFLFKRVHPQSDSASCQSSRATRKEGNLKSRDAGSVLTFFRKLGAILFPSTQLSRYCARLSRGEMALMVVTFPVFLLYHAIYAIGLMLKKKVKDVI